MNPLKLVDPELARHASSGTQDLAAAYRMAVEDLKDRADKMSLGSYQEKKAAAQIQKGISYLSEIYSQAAKVIRVQAKQIGIFESLEIGHRAEIISLRDKISTRDKYLTETFKDLKELNSALAELPGLGEIEGEPEIDNKSEPQDLPL